MRIKSKRLITHSFFVAGLLVLLVWLDRDQDGEPPVRDPGFPTTLDTEPRPNPRIPRPRVPLTRVAHLKLDPAGLGTRLILRGLVTTTEHAPIAGASVTLYAARQMATREFSDPLVVDTTGPDGRFEFQLDVGLTARGKSRHGIRPSLHPGGLRCDSVTYSRYAPSSRLVRRAQDRSRCSRDFRHGLLKAWLEVTSTGFGPVDERLGLETPGVRYTYFRLRQASASIEGRVFDAAEPLTTVTLEEGQRVEGRVLSETGQPVAGAALGIWSGAGLERGQFEKFLKSDSEETFSLVLERPPVRRISVQAPGYLTQNWCPEGDPTDPVEIRLKRGEGEIRGRVVDTRNRPVESFTLYLQRISPNGERSSFSQSFQNPRGTFSVLDLAAGEYQLSIRSLDRNTHMTISEGDTTVHVQKGHLSGEVIVLLIDLPATENLHPGAVRPAEVSHRTGVLC